MPLNTPHTKHKICMLGAFAVGKTSLVSQFVHSMFSTDYLTTVGVKVDKKQVWVDGLEISLLIWDIAGENKAHETNLNYLRGASAYLLVVDGTRRETLEAAERLHARIEAVLPGLPFVVMMNKSDLSGIWDVEETDGVAWMAQSLRVVTTSARTGEGVEEAFEVLARRLAASGTSTRE